MGNSNLTSETWKSCGRRGTDGKCFPTPNGYIHVKWYLPPWVILGSGHQPGTMKIHPGGGQGREREDLNPQWLPWAAELTSLKLTWPLDFFPPTINSHIVSATGSLAPKTYDLIHQTQESGLEPTYVFLQSLRRSCSPQSISCGSRVNIQPYLWPSLQPVWMDTRVLRRAEARQLACRSICNLWPSFFFVYHVVIWKFPWSHNLSSPGSNSGLVSSSLLGSEDSKQHRLILGENKHPLARRLVHGRLL